MKIKIFVGYLLPFEMKEAALKIETLSCIQHQGKSYIGRSIDRDQSDLAFIKKESAEIAKILQEHTFHSIEKESFSIFPELFIG